MVVLLAAMALSPAPDAWSMDLFIIGGGPEVLNNLDWLDKNAPENDQQRLLYPHLRTLADQKRSFMILDGGPMMTPFDSRRDWEVRYAMREYSEYDSAVEEIKRGNRTERRVLERTLSTSSQSGGIFARRWKQEAGYMAQHYFHRRLDDANRRFFVIQDLNSLESAMVRGNKDEKETIPRSFVISADSIRSTQEILQKNGIQPNGPVLCAYGIADPTSNVIAFPPPGIATHYLLKFEPTGVRIKFVDYIR